MVGPDAVLVVMDATTVERSLYLLMQVMEFGLPVIAAEADGGAKRRS